MALPKQHYKVVLPFFVIVIILTNMLYLQLVMIPRSEREREKREKGEKGENGIKGIPKVIHVVGQEWLQNMDSWKNLNPEYAVEFYDDERCLAFMQEHYPQFEFTYLHLKSVRRFDFIRYLIVYHFGGIYADSDITCKKPIITWGISNETTFLSGMECIGCEDIGAKVNQWSFGARKGHPILKHVIMNVVSNSFKGPSYYERFGTHGKVLHMTGPPAFTDGINYYLMEKETCKPKVGQWESSNATGLKAGAKDVWKENSGFVICSSITPFGFASGVQIFPWYRWGVARGWVEEASQPGIPDNLGDDLDAVQFIHHGYRGSWVGGER